MSPEVSTYISVIMAGSGYSATQLIEEIPNFSSYPGLLNTVSSQLNQIAAMNYTGPGHYEIYSNIPVEIQLEILQGTTILAQVYNQACMNIISNIDKPPPSPPSLETISQQSELQMLMIGNIK